MSSDIKLLVQMTNLSTKLASELFRLTKLQRKFVFDSVRYL